MEGRGGRREVTPGLRVSPPGLPPQSEDQEEIQEAVRTCSRLFGAMLERGELFVGQLPSEDALRTGELRGGSAVYTGRAPRALSYDGRLVRNTSSPLWDLGGSLGAGRGVIRGCLCPGLSERE